MTPNHRREEAVKKRTEHLLMTLLIGTLALTAAANAASANNLSVNEDEFELIWRPITFEAGVASIECNLTLLGHFHTRTINKTPGTLVADIDHGRIQGCEGGILEFLDETLPWNVRFEEWQGTLPTGIANIGVTVSNPRFRMEVSSFANCLTAITGNAFRGDIAIGGGVATSLTIDADVGLLINDIGGVSFLCDELEFLFFTGVASIKDLDQTIDIDVTLEGAPEPDPARLEPSPRLVTLTAVEESDSFTLRNTGGSTATLGEVTLEGVDRERPEFEVTSPGCRETIPAGGSCTYIVDVRSRPLDGARVLVEYDDGVNPEDAVATVEVEIEPEDEDPGLSGTAVTVGELEQNDTFVVRNGGDSAATITRVTVEAADAEAPEFSVSSPGCSGTLAPEESCSYTVAVNARPEDDGRVTLSYTDELGTRRLVVEVDIAEGPRPAVLAATPREVAITRLESNDSFVIRNVGTGTAAADITGISVEAADRERPEFSVSGPGCSLLVLDETSCTYVITVNSRPQREGWITFRYRNGVGGTAETRVRVDIEA